MNKLQIRLFKADLRHLIYYTEGLSREKKEDCFRNRINYIKTELKRMERYLEDKI
jgi:hypothetical protein